MRASFGHTGVIVGAAVACVLALGVYFTFRTPPGVTPMNGDGTATIAWISLAVAVLSFATALIGLVQKVIELRATRRD